MTFTQFEQSILDNKLPNESSVYLQSLWYDANGDWQKAHNLIDDLDDNTAAAIHAYLHRVEGNTTNANYWYRHAGKLMPYISLRDEWKTLVEGLLTEK